MMFRWFVGLNLDGDVWNYSAFTKNRDRLLEGEIAENFFEEVLAMAKKEDWYRRDISPSTEQAWASHKSFQRKEDDAQSGGGGKNPASIYELFSSNFGRSAKNFFKKERQF